MTRYSDRSTMLQIPSLNLNLKLTHFCEDDEPFYAESIDHTIIDGGHGDDSGHEQDSGHGSSG